MVPGVSRSGATIIGALLMRVDRPVATEFSFFLAIPTMIGALLTMCGKTGPLWTLAVMDPWVSCSFRRRARGRAHSCWFRQQARLRPLRLVSHPSRRLHARMALIPRRLAKARADPCSLDQNSCPRLSTRRRITTDSLDSTFSRTGAKDPSSVPIVRPGWFGLVEPRPYNDAVKCRQSTSTALQDP